MAGKLYALLVGIDRYEGPVQALQGCVNDIHRLKEYLRPEPAAPPTADDRVQLRVLLNEQATRQAVIDGFRQHLAQAGPGDVAFFAFSGHGSQEAAPPEFWEVEPDRKNETTLCFDSRSSARDLADKELNLLLGEVAARGPHVAVLLDCCHSGSGTRGEKRFRPVPPDD